MSSPDIGRLHIVGKAYDINEKTVNRLVEELEFYMAYCKDLKDTLICLEQSMLREVKDVNWEKP